MKEIPQAIARYVKKTAERIVGIDAYKVDTQELLNNRGSGVALGVIQVLTPTLERLAVNDEKTNKSVSLNPASATGDPKFIGAIIFDTVAKVATGGAAISVAALYTRNPEEMAGAIIAAELGLNATTHIAIDSAVAVKNRFSNKLTSLKHSNS